MIKKLTYTTLLALAGSIGFAQLPKIAFEKYGVEEGLPEETVRNIVQDNQGFIWAITQNGLVKFDGYKMQVFRANKKMPGALHIDSQNGLLLAGDGHLWMGGTIGGRGAAITSFDPETEKFTNYPVDPVVTTKAPYTFSRSVFEDISGNIWFIFFSNEGRLSGKIDTKTKQVSQYPNTWPLGNPIGGPQMVESKKDSSIWINTPDGKFMRYDRDKNIFKQIFQKGDILPGTNVRDSIRNIAQPGKSGLIPLINDRHLYLWDPLAREVVESYSFPAHKNVESWEQMGSFEDESGNFWVFNPGYLTRINRDRAQRDDFKFGEGVLSFKDAPVDIQYIYPGYQDSNFIMFKVISKDYGNSTLRYDLKSGVFNYFDGQFNDPHNQFPDFKNNVDRKFLMDRTGLLWIGTRPNMYKESPKTRQIAHFKHDPADNYSLPADTINVLFEDSKQRLWVGTSNGMALKMDEGRFQRMTAFDGMKTNVKIGSTWQIMEDSRGQTWVCTDKGLFRWSESKNSFQKLLTNFKEELNVQALAEDSKGRIWASAMDKGTYVLDAVNGNILQRFELKDTASHFLLGGEITTIFKDSKDQIWLGDRSWDNNKYGLFRYVESEERFVHYGHKADDSTSISNNRINFMAEDDLGRMWVGLDNGGGLNLYDREHDLFLRNNDRINIKHAMGYARASGGKMWLSTYSGGGLALVGPGVNDVILFGEEKGLLHIDGTGYGQLASDDFGKLYLPTWRGLSVFDTASQTFTSYFREDGFQEYGRGTIGLKTKNGDIWIGGYDGLNHIDPARLLAKDSTLPAVLITSMGILDSMYSAPDGVIFEKAVSYTKKIQLQYWQKDISFDFVALHYLRPKDNQYSWKLENYDKEWTAPSKERHISYTNLSPGRYTFHVKASNADGVWNDEGASITLVISPPWWLTWWAYLIYAFLFMLGVYKVHRYQQEKVIRKERENARELELQQAKEIEKAYTELKTTQSQLIQSEKMASLGELTAGIAHEIQNPLNFVNNFSEVNKELMEELMEALDKNDSKEVRAIAKDIIDNDDKVMHHGKRAEAIVKSMLQHSRSSSGEKELTNINALADEYLRLAYHGFRAKDKSFNADFKTELADGLPEISVVPQDIGRVLLNLINNAFQAVKDVEKPMVTVTTRTNSPLQGGKGGVEIRVKDNGSGIPESIKDKIFQPFFTTKATGEGTGLGLSLSYDIVTKGHGGELRVENKEEVGSEFIVYLPLS